MIYTSGTTGQPKGVLHGHRVLLGHLPGVEISHNFLPRHRAGTEVYTWQLGRELLGRGHDVRVFTSEKEISAPDGSLRVCVDELLFALYEWNIELYLERLEEVLSSTAATRGSVGWVMVLPGRKSPCTMRG